MQLSPDEVKKEVRFTPHRETRSSWTNLALQYWCICEAAKLKSVKQPYTRSFPRLWQIGAHEKLWETPAVKSSNKKEKTLTYISAFSTPDRRFESVFYQRSFRICKSCPKQLYLHYLIQLLRHFLERECVCVRSLYPTLSTVGISAIWRDITQTATYSICSLLFQPAITLSLH